MKWFRILAMILCSLVLIAMLIGCARSESIFPNEDLEAAVRYSLGKPAGEEITVDELAILTTLQAEKRDIIELTGLEHCTSLVELDLRFNDISDVSPLSSLTKLTELSLGENQISDISPLSSLTNLTRLTLWRNQISDISPLSSLTNLTGLDLSNNKISDIAPLSSLTNLSWLNLNDNLINNILPLVKNSGLGAGDRVFISGNNLVIEEHTEIWQYIEALEDRGVIIHHPGSW